MDIENTKRQYDKIIKEYCDSYEKWAKEHLKGEDFKTLTQVTTEVPRYFKKYEERYGSIDEFRAMLTKKCVDACIFWQIHKEEENALRRKYGDNIEFLSPMEKSSLISPDTDDITNMITEKAAGKIVLMQKKEANA